MSQHLRHLWQIIRPQKRLIFAGLIFLLLTAAARIAQPMLVRSAIDDHLLVQGSGSLALLLGFYLLAAAMEAACRRWQLIGLETAGQNALLTLRLKVFAHLQRLPAAFFDRTPLGRLVGRVTTDIEALQELFSSGVVTILGDIIFMLAIVGLLLALSVKLTLATFLVVPVLVLVTLFIRLRVRKAYNAMRERLSQMNGFLHEQVSGMPTVQLFGLEGQRLTQMAQINGGVRDAQLRSVRWESILSAITEMLSSLTTALILWSGGQLIMGNPQQDLLSLGTLFAFVDLMQKFFVPLNDLSLKYTVLQNAMVASERVFDLLGEEAQSSEDDLTEVKAGAGEIEFRDVTFGYDPEQPVLKNLSFKIRPGERIAIVGATGAGKTSILSLLTRLYDIQQGSILLDGVELAADSPARPAAAHWRSGTGRIPVPRQRAGKHPPGPAGGE